ncbi:MAG: Crp/Fnr family transcriptional regulator [Bacteroidaceae bacterium]|nr:Crp/Fnr family transcriptional regulator [Bacteroides sp.]MBQ8241942.1 Crp/Fnr family transcriptional regulator [Bacteroidaceae bacterium]
MSQQFDMAKRIIAATCPNRKLQLESIQLFADIIQQKKYPKGAIILAEGEVCNNLLFIEHGLLRQHYVKHGKDMTEHIAYEGGVVLCIESYFHRIPTQLMIESLESCVVWEIPHDIIEELSETNCDISYLYRCFIENSLILSQVKADILRFESAKEKYLKLMQLYPEIVKRAPLMYIASYLQMTLETLSRVRATLT